MPRLKRIYDDLSQFYFITSKTYQNEKIFNDDNKIKLFLKCVKYLAKQKYFSLFAWVILPDHFHLLLEIIGKKNISQIMHDLKSYTANQISRLFFDRRQGFHALPSKLKGSRSVEASATERKYVKIWQTSFYDHLIRNQQDLYNHLDYIHYNSVVVITADF